MTDVSPKRDRDFTLIVTDGWGVVWVVEGSLAAFFEVSGDATGQTIHAQDSRRTPIPLERRLYPQPSTRASAFTEPDYARVQDMNSTLRRHCAASATSATSVV